MKCPHLIETTLLGDMIRTFTIGLGYTEEDLTDHERELIKASEWQLAENQKEEDRRIKEYNRYLKELADKGLGIRYCDSCGGDGYIWDGGDEYACDVCNGSGDEIYILEKEKIMKFYVITNGYVGDGYCRVYVAAETDDRAKEIASGIFKKELDEHSIVDDDEYYDIERLQIVWRLDSNVEGGIDKVDD